MKLATDIELGQLRGQGGIGLEGDIGQVELGESLVRFSDVLSLTIGVLTVVAFIWFVFKLITGAIGILGSGGDKNKLAEARANITYGIVGLILVISAIFLAGIIGTVLGVNILEISSLIANIGNR